MYFCQKKMRPFYGRHNANPITKMFILLEVKFTKIETARFMNDFNLY